MSESAVLSRPAHGFAALQRGAAVVPFDFMRRALRPHDVAPNVLFCGICHTGLHAIGAWDSNFRWCPATRSSGG